MGSLWVEDPRSFVGAAVEAATDCSHQSHPSSTTARRLTSGTDTGAKSQGRSTTHAFYTSLEHVFLLSSVACSWRTKGRFSKAVMRIKGRDPIDLWWKPGADALVAHHKLPCFVPGCPEMLRVVTSPWCLLHPFGTRSRLVLLLATSPCSETALQEQAASCCSGALCSAYPQVPRWEAVRVFWSRAVIPAHWRSYIWGPAKDVVQASSEQPQECLWNTSYNSAYRKGCLIASKYFVPSVADTVTGANRISPFTSLLPLIVCGDTVVFDMFFYNIASHNRGKKHCFP